MFKRPFSLIIFAAASLITSVSYAELFSFQTNTNSPQTQTPGQTTPPLSANDFKSKVATDSQKAQQELFQQTLNNVKQQSSQMPLPNSPPKPPQLNQQQNTTSTPSTEESTTSTSSKLPYPTLEDVEKSQSTTTTTTTTTPPPSSPSPAASAPTPATATPSPPATQSQVYTGFGAGSTNNTTTTTTAPSSQPSGGWNVKY